MSFEIDQDQVVRRIGEVAKSPGWGKAFFPFIIALLLVWAAITSYHTIEPEGQAVVLRFGKVVAVKEPGLHFKLPFGIDRTVFVPTKRVLKEEFGFATVEPGRRTDYAKTPEHLGVSLMLSGDLNVIDVEWVVQYRIDDPVKWLFTVRNPVETLRDISESVMRQIVGNRLGKDVLTIGRVEIAELARQKMQETLSDASGGYDMGVFISNVELQDVTPPDPVKPAFNAVNEARQKRESLINEAERQRNQQIPQANGAAKSIISNAEGEAAERVNRATGDVASYEAIRAEYEQSPDVTRRRLYLEMIDEVMPKAGRVIVIEPGHPSPLPLMNLDTNTNSTGGSR